jgi:hydrogenase nickel incorporation protein HypA/HybF
MHEISLCEAIAAAAERHSGGRPVVRIELSIGQLRQVVPDTLRSCWGIVTGGTDLDGCELAVDEIPLAVECRSCGRRSELDAPVLMCPNCAGRDVELVSGDEFLITSMTIVKEDV